MNPAAPGGEAVWQDVECGAYAADLALWRRLGEEAAAGRGGRCELLDLGCGTGRVALALAGPRCDVTALDCDQSLVEELRRRAHAHGVRVRALAGDACSFALRKRFDLVLAPMQLVQLLPDREQRAAMLISTARHLRPGGRVAITLMKLEQEWSASAATAPLPDMLERDGWVYSSQPVGVRANGEDEIVLERVRRRVSPRGDMDEALSTVALALVEPAEVEQDARAVGLEVERRLHVRATRDHVGSVVVVASAPRSVADG